MHNFGKCYFDVYIKILVDLDVHINWYVCIYIFISWYIHIYVVYNICWVLREKEEREYSIKGCGRKEEKGGVEKEQKHKKDLKKKKKSTKMSSYICKSTKSKSPLRSFCVAAQVQLQLCKLLPPLCFASLPASKWGAWWLSVPSSRLQAVHWTWLIGGLLLCPEIQAPQ